MATYVISDIHGYFIRFKNLLNKVNFDAKKDTLYILGDICDRGPQNAEMIEWAYDQPSSVKFIRGNHDDFLVTYMRKFFNNTPKNKEELESYKYDFAYNNIWIVYNGGIKTFDYLASLPRERAEDIVNWIDKWPLFYDIEVNGRRFVLVHAGIVNRIRLGDDFFSDGLNKDVEIKGFECVWSQTLLWTRATWFSGTASELPCDVVFGHTPTANIYDLLVWTDEDKEYYNIKGEPPHFLHFGYQGRAHAIDTGRKTMGILRLDDMQEFYSDED